MQRYISNADKQKHISQMQTSKAKISSLILLKDILLGKCVLVGLLVTQALNKVIQ